MPRVTRHRASLDAAAFAAVAQQHPRMHPDSLAAARAVLVDGQSILDSAKQLGVSKQRVAKLISLLLPEALPAGWVSGTVSLPPEQMAAVREMERLARQTLTR